MTNPTSNYNFQMPTATNLVTDLPADFEVFGQAVDTRLKALQPGTTSGDLAYSSATANTNVRLPIGTSGQVLAVSGGGVPEWTTTADVTPLTTKGDLFTFTTVDARIGVGANNTVLTADSAEATGLKWATPAAGGTWTQVATGSLTGATVTISSLTAANDFLVVCDGISHNDTSSNQTLNIRLNGDAGSNYYLPSTPSSATTELRVGNNFPGADNAYLVAEIVGCKGTQVKYTVSTGASAAGGYYNSSSNITSITLGFILSGATMDNGTYYIWSR